MSAIDFEEVKDLMSQRELEFVLLEKSISEFSLQCDQRMAKLAAERDEAVSKVGQLEILLRARQAALIAREEELQILRGSVARRRFELRTETSDVTEVAKSRKPLLSLNCLVPHIVLFPVPTSPSASPPHTVCRKKVGGKKSTRHSPASSSSESIDSPPRPRIRRSVDNRFRDSFASVRSSSVRVVSSSDSDASLDELVSTTLRLSRSSAASSLVRYSTGSTRR